LTVAQTDGNPLCWDGHFTYDHCCSMPGGNPDCWHEHFQYTTCCEWSSLQLGYIANVHRNFPVADLYDAESCPGDLELFSVKLAMQRERVVHLGVFVEPIKLQLNMCMPPVGPSLQDAWLRMLIAMMSPLYNEVRKLPVVDTAEYVEYKHWFPPTLVQIEDVRPVNASEKLHSSRMWMLLCVSCVLWVPALILGQSPVGALVQLARTGPKDSASLSFLRVVTVFMISLNHTSCMHTDAVRYNIIFASMACYLSLSPRRRDGFRGVVVRFVAQYIRLFVAAAIRSYANGVPLQTVELLHVVPSVHRNILACSCATSITRELLGESRRRWIAAMAVSGLFLSIDASSRVTADSGYSGWRFYESYPVFLIAVSCGGAHYSAATLLNASSCLKRCHQVVGWISLLVLFVFVGCLPMLMDSVAGKWQPIVPAALCIVLLLVADPLHSTGPPATCVHIVARLQFITVMLEADVIGWLVKALRIDPAFDVFLCDARVNGITLQTGLLTLLNMQLSTLLSLAVWLSLIAPVAFLTDRGLQALSQ